MTEDGGGGTSLGVLDQERLELAATIVVSIAVVLTAWSAFQAGKWRAPSSQANGTERSC